MSVPNKREFKLIVYIEFFEVETFLSTDIHWPGSHDAPPPDVPDCGFLGNDPSCQSNGTKSSNVLSQSLNDDVQKIAIKSLLASSSLVVLLFSCFFSFTC